MCCDRDDDDDVSVFLLSSLTIYSKPTISDRFQQYQFPRKSIVDYHTNLGDCRESLHVHSNNFLRISIQPDHYSSPGQEQAFANTHQSPYSKYGYS